MFDWRLLTVVLAAAGWPPEVHHECWIIPNVIIFKMNLHLIYSKSPSFTTVGMKTFQFVDGILLFRDSNCLVGKQMNLWKYSINLHNPTTVGNCCIIYFTSAGNTTIPPELVIYCV
jgi:hypothetical protein